MRERDFQAADAAGGRIDGIDALRATALFGVIIFNIIAMVAGFLAKDLLATAGPLDQGAIVVDLLLIQGKARSCFAFLFGVGFGILMDRAARHGQGFTGFYLRRMLALLAIGLFNLTFLFYGDILILYAVLGMAMLPFRNLADRSLLRLGLVLVVLPPIVGGLIEAMTGAPLPNLAGLSPTEVGAIMPATIDAYRGGDFAAYVLANFRYYIDHYRTDTGNALVYDLGVLGLFLLGLWTARNRVLVDIDRWRPLLRRVVWWCLPLGLVLSLVYATRRVGIPAEGALYGMVTATYVGLPVMAFGYVAGICLLLAGPARWLRRALAPMGRMALTGYLGSNAIGSWFWYGWGLGMIGRWNVAAMTLFAIAIFIGLCVFSTLWLRAFRHGPAEWFWRSLTHGRPQPLRR